MKNFTKQILSGAVAASTVLSLIPSAMAAVPSDVQGTRYEDPVQLLSALKIMIGDENGKFRLDDTIIRSEVAKMAIHTMGLDEAAEASKGPTKFDDVSEEHWANGYINLASQQGLIVGDGDGNFRPNAPISYAEAMTIMVQATGYTVSAENQGGYPNGYIKVGNSNGLSKNVQGSPAEEISRGNVAYLTTNALDVNLMEQTGFGSDSRYEITDKTLLKDYLKVTKHTGQITAVENASLSGNSKLGKNQVKIGDTVYSTECALNDLLGYNVDYHVKNAGKNGEEVILALPSKGQNSDLVINASVFSGITTKSGNTAVEYFENENSSKTKTVELASDAVLIYNGKYESMDSSLLDIKDKSGRITLLDSDKDGKYDIVSVKSYENIVVEEVTSSNKIIDKYSNSSLKLDDSVDFSITLSGEKLQLSDLKEFDVLSVAASLDNELYEIVVTRDSVEGKVSGKDSKGLLIDGNRYKVAANYTDTISIGTEGVFFLDADGKIAAVDTASSVSSNYGYLMRAYFSKTTSDKASFKIFTRDGRETTFDSNAKIKFNGKSGVKAEEVVNAINSDSDTTPSQLITYTVNSDNVITALNTAEDNSSSGAVNSDRFTMNYSLTNAKFSKALSKLGNVRINNDTVIFDIPENSEDYAVRTVDVFEDEQKYNAFVYDMTDNYTAGAIVVTNAQFSASSDAPLAVVTDIISAVNSDDEQTDMLEALVDGKEVSLYAENENILVKGESKLEKGDLIQYRTNSENEIVSVRVLMDINSRNEEIASNPAEKLETVYGRVTKKFDNSINVRVNDDSEVNYVIGSDVNVYSVDMTVSKNNVNTAGFSDIQKFDSEENNRVFIKIYDNRVEEIVIIK